MLRVFLASTPFLSHLCLLGHRDDAWECAQAVADYLSKVDRLKNYEIQEYSESLDGNTLTVKKGFLTGFTDIEAVQADLYDLEDAYELSVSACFERPP